MRIPIKISPMFWLLASLIALLLSEGNLVALVLWVVAIFFSVLFHELGHAVTALYFGLKPRIELIAMGGLTYHEGGRLSFGKQFLITLNGPLFGALLGVICWVLSEKVENPVAVSYLFDVAVLNWFWSVVNLLPILPLDGGQLMRILFEALFHAKGLRYAILVSGAVALVVSLLLFWTHYFLLGAILFLFAFEGYTNFRQLHASEGSKVAEKAAFESYKIGRRREAFLMLKSFRKELSQEGLELLHQVAFEEGDYVLVEALSGELFKVRREPDLVIRAAMAAAACGHAEAAVGWLETGREMGGYDVRRVIENSSFDVIRGSAEFQAFVRRLK